MQSKGVLWIDLHLYPKGTKMSLYELVVGVVVLLLVAVMVRALSKRFELPFTVLLVVWGIVLAQLALYLPYPLNQFARIEISQDVILFIFLPTLIFESAFNLDARKLRQNLVPILVLAIPGVLLSTAIVGGLLYWLTPLSGIYALILGALLSATDPVAVIAIFKQLGVPKRLSILVEGESLFNDATAIVLTHILIGVAVSGGFGVEEVTYGVAQFVGVFAGGLWVGVVMALLFGWVIGRIQNDALMEIPLTMVLAYASFIVAETMHLSGVMAVVAAGVMMGGWGRTKISPAVSHYLSELWEYFAFMANAFIFLIVGLLVNLDELLKSFDILVWVIAAMLISRFVVVYTLVPLSNRWSGIEKIGSNYQHVIYWGGLRGAVALALVLSLPPSEFQSLLLALSAGAVLFTLIVQGLSIKALVHRLGLDRPSLGERLAYFGSALDAVNEAKKAIPALEKYTHLQSSMVHKLNKEYDSKLFYWKSGRKRLVHTELSPKEEHSLLFLESFIIKKKSYYAMFTQGDLSEQDYRDLSHSIDMQMDYIHAYEQLPQATLHNLFLRRMERKVLHFLNRYFHNSKILQRYSRYYTARDYTKSFAQYYGSMRVLEALPQRAKLEGIGDKSLEAVMATYTQWHKSAFERLEQTYGEFPEFVERMQERRIRRLVLLVERRVVEKHLENGEVSQKLGNDLLESIDHELRQLRGYDTHGLNIHVNELLSKVDFFKEMQPNQLETIKTYLSLRIIPPRETIVVQGEEGHSMFFIARGEIEVIRHQGGKDRAVGVLKGGDFFGEHSLLSHQVRNATCRTLTPCALYELHSKEFYIILQTFPKVQQALDSINEQRDKAMDA